MTTWKVKQETANRFQNTDTPERYLETFLSNVYVEKQNDCDIWLDDGTIIIKLKITKGSTIAWETENLADI